MNPASPSEPVEVGEMKIRWAEAHAPVLSRVAHQRLPEGSLSGIKIGVDLPTEPKTAYLCLLLARAGAEVTLGADPFFVHADVAAALQRRGITVVGYPELGDDGGPSNLERVLERGPNLILDGAGQLGALAHTTHAGSLAHLRGVAEETTTGVRRYRRMAEEGILRVPVLAANDAEMKHLFDNRYGTGQSGLGALMATTNLMIPGKRIVVVGYGWVGKGFARFASAMGARIVVSEVDPVRGVEAFADGFEVMPLVDAVAHADVIVTATGTPGAVTARHFERMKDGVILENVGGTGAEIDLAALRGLTRRTSTVRPSIEEFTLTDGRRVNVLGGGQVFNVTSAAEGHPVEIMDTTFAIQVLCIKYLAEHARDMDPGVYPIPHDFDEIVARARLESVGMQVDDLDDRQQAALAAWEEA